MFGPVVQLWKIVVKTV